MIKALTNLWKTYETKQLAYIFKNYMESMGVKKWNSQRKDNRNTYLIDGKDTDWNRVQCYYHKDSDKYPYHDLLIVLRKRSGNYLIVERQGVRAFEIDYGGIKHYDENLLNEIAKDHKPLFDALLSIKPTEGEPS